AVLHRRLRPLRTRPRRRRHPLPRPHRPRRLPRGGLPRPHRRDRRHRFRKERPRMTTTTAGAAGATGTMGAARAPSILRLTMLHAKYTLIETFRTPIAVIGTLVFPALALLFFVVPNRTVADNPEFATQAVISLAVFAVMTNGLFSFGLTIAENREKPWDPYLRTMPAPGVARVLAQIFSTGLLGFVAIIPVIIIGGLFTAAEATPA